VMAVNESLEARQSGFGHAETLLDFLRAEQRK